MTLFCPKVQQKSEKRSSKKEENMDGTLKSDRHNNVHFTQHASIIDSSSSSNSSLYSHVNDFVNSCSSMEHHADLTSSSAFSYTADLLFNHTVDLSVPPSTAFSAFDGSLLNGNLDIDNTASHAISQLSTISSNVQGGHHYPDLTTHHSLMCNGMELSILGGNGIPMPTPNHSASSHNGKINRNSTDNNNSSNQKSPLEVALAGAVKTNIVHGTINGSSNCIGTATHLITAAQMNAMDVSDLNTMMSIVVPHNKGNSNMKREWRNVGWFTTEEAMNEVRKRQRVSKWKSVDQINGLKVFFRCNKWKRTNCNYRMYVMYYSVDRISLNESGQHDHSTLNLDYKPRVYNKSNSMGARAVFEATPSSSQQRVLDQLIMSATSQSSVTAPSFDNENKCYESENASRSSPRTPSCAANDGRESGADGAYQLSDGQNIAELLQVAADMDLTFTFNSRRTGEYCFESNLPTMKGKMVVFSDLGDKISITERHDGVDQSGEEWKKADWKQFLWAVRGKCMNALKGI